MNDDEFFIAIEELELEKRELKNSKIYQIGSALSLYSDDLCHLRFQKVIKNISDNLASRKIRKKTVLIDSGEPDSRFEKPDKIHRIVVYTCVVGNYDNIKLPLVNFDNVDYVILSDNPEHYQKYEKQYKILPLPKRIIEMGKIKANRYAKFHPAEFFASDYDYSIYVDGNVRIISDIRKYIPRSSPSTGLAMYRHRERDCAYQEAEACILLRRGKPDLISEQMNDYQDAGFPEHFGLNEATIIVSDLRNKNSAFLLNEWWNEFSNRNSMRDQIAWPFVLWKNNFQISDIGILGMNIYQSPLIEIEPHAA